MASLSLTELLIGPDFYYQVNILAWEGYLLEQSSVFNTVMFCWSSPVTFEVAGNCDGGMVDCLLIRAKPFFDLATWESAMTECMPVVGSSL